MKKSYTAPDMAVLEVRADERFAANCGPVKEFGNVGDSVNRCTITHGGPEYIPNNS